MVVVWSFPARGVPTNLRTKKAQAAYRLGLKGKKRQQIAYLFTGALAKGFAAKSG